jgi:hypothetical protein
MTPFVKITVLAAGLMAFDAGAVYDANGVPLGASEKAVTRQFPSAYCKPLEWTSNAADRRCDDAKIEFAGVAARVTFYLKQDKVQAFDVRFDTKDAERVAAFLKTRYGAPSEETRETMDNQGKPRELYKVQWGKGDELAVLISHKDRRRATFTVSRSDFEEEIYRVR